MRTLVIEGLVSTVIPVYNRPSMLCEAVDSVLAQTWEQIEVIVVDDGSTDGTTAVARELSERHPERVRMLQQSNAGPGVARQYGLGATRGEFVQFLDSDDLLLPNKFELQVSGLRGDLEADISYGKSYVSNLGVRSAEPAQRSGHRFRTLFPALLQEPIWPTMTPLYRRSFLDRSAPWPRTRQLEDWVYDAQAAALGVKLHYVDEFIAETRNHGEARLCHLWQRDASAMRERVAAYTTILHYAEQAGVQRDAVEMQDFVRTLFWMARNAGRYGMVHEARELFELSRSRSLKAGWDYRIFSLAAKTLGWARASRLAEAIRSMLA